jgi:hypothetical protein
MYSQTSPANRAYQRDFAKWLESQVWDVFVTLTFRWPVSHSSAWSAIEHWSASIRDRAGRQLTSVVFLERSSGGLWHAHVLLGNVGSLTSGWLRKRWIFGISEAKKYVVGGGACQYVVKWVGTDRMDFRLNPFPEEPQEQNTNSSVAVRRSRIVERRSQDVANYPWTSCTEAPARRLSPKVFSRGRHSTARCAPGRLADPEFSVPASEALVTRGKYSSTSHFVRAAWRRRSQIGPQGSCAVAPRRHCCTVRRKQSWLPRIVAMGRKLRVMRRVLVNWLSRLGTVIDTMARNFKSGNDRLAPAKRETR